MCSYLTFSFFFSFSRFVAVVNAEYDLDLNDTYYLMFGYSDSQGMCTIIMLFVCLATSKSIVIPDGKSIILYKANVYNTRLY